MKQEKKAGNSHAVCWLSDPILSRAGTFEGFSAGGVP